MFPPTLPHAHPVAIHWFSFIFIFSTNFKRKLMNLFLPLSLRWVVYNSVLFHSLHPFPRLAWHDRPSPRGSSPSLHRRHSHCGCAVLASRPYRCRELFMHLQMRGPTLWLPPDAISDANRSTVCAYVQLELPGRSVWSKSSSAALDGTRMSFSIVWRMQYYYFSEIKHVVCTSLQMFDEMSKSASIVFRLVFFFPNAQEIRVKLNACLFLGNYA
jgi:hypothetical protein